jgi:prepilin-type processing-associated H-X9-DG protein
MFGIGPAELAVVSAVFFALGGSALPVGLPPLPADPMVERAAPEECLFYSSWNGTGVPDPKSENLTERLLAEPELQAFGQQLAVQIRKALETATKQNAQAEVLADALPVVLKTLAMRPGAIYVSKIGPTPPKVSIDAALLVSAGDEAPKLREALARLEGLLAGALGDRARVEKTEISGVEFKRLRPAPDAPVIVWGFKDELFILAIGEDEAAALLKRLSAERKTPEWLKDIRDELNDDRPAGVTYVNLAGILETAAPFLGDPTAKMAVDTLGISQLDYLANIRGLEGPGMVIRSLLAIEGEPKGLLKLIPAKPLDVDDLKFIPRSATSATVARFNLLDTYRTGLALASAFNPESVGQFEAALAQAEQQIGLRLIDDFLKPLGDRWSMYSSSEEGGGLWMMGGLVASVTLDDADRFAATHDRVLAMAESILAHRPKPEARIRQTTIADVKVYTLQPNIPFFMAPSWAITKDRLIVTLSRQMMKAVLERPAQAPSLANLDSVRKALKRGPSLLSYQDTAALVTSLYPLVQMLDPLISGGLAQQGIEFDLPTLPSLAVLRRHLTPTVATLRRTDAGFLSEQMGSAAVSVDMATVVPMAVGVLLPAVQAAREKSRQMISMNNLRNVNLAMLVMANTDGHLPAPALADPALADLPGKPLLSWRVAILPFLGEDELYRSFHLNERWDSPHNRPLLERMPRIYADASHPELTAAGRTRYVLPTGAGTLFSGPIGPTLDRIPDGTSSTIMLLEAVPEQAVEWTRPQDIAIDPKDPAASLKLPHGGRFQAGMADGSVRAFTITLDATALRRPFDPADGG